MKFPIGEQKLNNAFTLIEIILVVIIAGVILALSVPNFSKEYSQFQFNKTAEDLLDMSRWAQAMAIGQERIYALSFSEDRRSYGLVRKVVGQESIDQTSFEAVKGLLGKMHRLPDKIRLETNDDRIEFYPDGTIDPSEIQLVSPQKKEVLSTTEVRGMMTKVNDEK